MPSTDGRPAAGPPPPPPADHLAKAVLSKTAEPAADVNQNVLSEVCRLQLAVCWLAPQPCLVAALQDGLEGGFWPEAGQRGGVESPLDDKTLPAAAGSPVRSEPEEPPPSPHADSSASRGTSEPSAAVTPEMALLDDSSGSESLSQIALCVAISLSSGRLPGDSSGGDTEGPVSVQLPSEQPAVGAAVDVAAGPAVGCETAAPAVGMSDPAAAAVPVADVSEGQPPAAASRDWQRWGPAVVSGGQDTPVTDGVAAPAAGGPASVLQHCSLRPLLNTPRRDCEDTAAGRCEVGSVMPTLESSQLVRIWTSLEGGCRPGEVTPVSGDGRGVDQATDQDSEVLHMSVGSSIDRLSTPELRTPGNQIKYNDDEGSQEAASTTTEPDRGTRSQTTKSISDEWHFSQVSQSGDVLTAIHICDKLPEEADVEPLAQVSGGRSPPEDGEIVDTDDDSESPELTLLHSVDKQRATGTPPELGSSQQSLAGSRATSAAEQHCSEASQSSAFSVISAESAACERAAAHTASARGRGRGRGRGRRRSTAGRRPPPSPVVTARVRDTADQPATPRRRGRPRKTPAAAQQSSPAPATAGSAGAAAGVQDDTPIVPTIAERLFLRKRSLSDLSSPAQKRAASTVASSSPVPTCVTPVMPCRVTVETLTRHSAKKLCRRHGLKIGRSVKKCLKLSKLFSRAKDRVKSMLPIKSGRSTFSCGESVKSEEKTETGEGVITAHKGDGDVNQELPESNAAEKSSQSVAQTIIAPEPDPAAPLSVETSQAIPSPPPCQSDISSDAMPSHTPCHSGISSHAIPSHTPCHSDVPARSEASSASSVTPTKLDDGSVTAASGTARRPPCDATAAPSAENPSTGDKQAKTSTAVTSAENHTTGDKQAKTSTAAPSAENLSTGDKQAKTSTAVTSAENHTTGDKQAKTSTAVTSAENHTTGDKQAKTSTAATSAENPSTGDKQAKTSADRNAEVKQAKSVRKKIEAPSPVSSAASRQSIESQTKFSTTNSSKSSKPENQRKTKSMAAKGGLRNLKISLPSADKKSRQVALAVGSSARRTDRARPADGHCREMSELCDAEVTDSSTPGTASADEGDKQSDMAAILKRLTARTLRGDFKIPKRRQSEKPAQLERPAFDNFTIRVPVGERSGGGVKSSVTPGGRQPRQEDSAVTQAEWATLLDARTAGLTDLSQIRLPPPPPPPPLPLLLPPPPPPPPLPVLPPLLQPPPWPTVGSGSLTMTVPTLSTAPRPVVATRPRGPEAAAGPYVANAQYPTASATSVRYAEPPPSAGQLTDDSGDQAAAPGFPATQLRTDINGSTGHYVTQSEIQVNYSKEQRSTSAELLNLDSDLLDTNYKYCATAVAAGELVSAAAPTVRCTTFTRSESVTPSTSSHGSDEIVVVQEEEEESLPAELQMVRLAIAGRGAEQLVLIPDQLEPTPAERASYEFCEFISDDPAENADNNAVEWEVMRRLTSDSERYRFVRQRWRNTEIPDPHRCLTFYGYRRRLVRASLQRMGLLGRRLPEPASGRRGRGLKRTLSATSCDSRPAGKRPRLAAGCAFMADWLLDQGRTLLTAGRLLPSLKVRRRRMEQEKNSFCRQLSFNPQLTPAQRRWEVSHLQEQQLRELHQEFGRRARRAANRLSAVKAETETFFRFYTGLNNTDAEDASWLTEQQRQEVEDFEDYIVGMDRVYGECLDEDL